MKFTTILTPVVASLIGGAIGALVVWQIALAPQPAPVPALAGAQLESYDDSTLRHETKRNAEAIVDLQGELLRTQGRINELALERNSLLEENRQLKDGSAVGAQGEIREAGASKAEIHELETEVDRAVAEALKKQADQEREEKVAATRNETESWMGDARDNIVSKLDAELSLSQYQRDRIIEIMANTTQRVSELMASGGGKGEDGRTQWNSIWRETGDAIRSELEWAQQSAYDELVGERGIVSIAWEGK